MQTQETTLIITRHQAAAARAVITEINQLQQLLQVKQGEFKRLTDMLQLDAGLDPDAFTIDGIAEVKGEQVLKLRAKPEPKV